MTKRKIVLIFVGHYLPGLMSGGILRSVENMVNQLSDNIDFLIITRNKDTGSLVPYANIKVGEWKLLGRSKIYYLDDKASNLSNIIKLINKINYDYLFINSFFDKLSMKIILAHKLGKLPHKKLILSPRGEFAWASFKLNKYRKFLFITFSRLIGLYSGIKWHVSSPYEMKDLMRAMNIKKKHIKLAMDLPTVTLRSYYKNEQRSFCGKKLRVVFLSRISEEKNLDIAIKILSKVNSNIIFDIYGSIDSPIYWHKCQKLINNLPRNIETQYCGFVNPNQVLDIFSKYDLFLFPTGGENYGHVIAESMSVGTKALISVNTPWRNLEKDEIGWDFNISREEKFVAIIEKMAIMNLEERMKQRTVTREAFVARLNNSSSLKDNRDLFD